MTSAMLRTGSLNPLGPTVSGTLVSDPGVHLLPADRSTPEIDSALAAQIAVARARQLWGGSPRVVQISPIVDSAFETLMYDIDVALEGSSSLDSRGIATDWQSRLARTRWPIPATDSRPSNSQSRNAAVSDSSPDPPYGRLTIAATYGRYPVVAASRTPSNLLVVGSTLATVAANILDVDQAALTAVFADGPWGRRFLFEGNGKRLVFEGHKPWRYFDAVDFLDRLNDSKRAMQTAVKATAQASHLDLLDAMNAEAGQNRRHALSILQGETSSSGCETTCASPCACVPNIGAFEPFEWHAGCSPTAAAMVLNFWDTSRTGYGRLNEWYQEAADPADNDYDCHVAQVQMALVPWFGTDASGYTEPGAIYEGMLGYTNAQGYAFAPGVSWNGGPAYLDLTWHWNDIVSEIDGGYPFVWTLSWYDGGGKHSVAAVGYDSSTQDVLFYDDFIGWVLQRAHYAGGLYDSAHGAGIHPGGGGENDIKLTSLSGRSSLVNPWNDFRSCITTESHSEGDEVVISWNNFGIPAASVRLLYSKDGGVTWKVVTEVPDAGSYTWLIPSGSATQSGRIMVQQYDAFGALVSSDSSWGNFEIRNACYPLLVATAPWSGGTAVAVGGDCSGGYTQGTVVAISATPATGYSFSGWTGAGGTIGNAASPSTTFTIGGSASITANFNSVNPPVCTGFTVSPPAVDVGSGEGLRAVALIGLPSGCQGGVWTAAGNGSWLTVTPTGGNGSGSVAVSWLANALTTARSGTARIAGNSFGVTQAGTTAVAPPAPYLLMPGASVFPGTTTGSLSPPFSWLTVTGADSYQLEVSDASGVVATQTAAAPQLSVVLGTSLADNHAYKWRMRSHGTAGWGSFGGYYYFSTYTGLTTGDFGLSATPSAGAVTPGGSAAFVINTWTAQGSTQNLALGVGGLPSGVAATFSSLSVQSGGQSTLTLDVSSGTVPGGYTVTATGTSSVGVTHSIAIGLTVNPPPTTGEPAVCLTPSSLGFSDQMVGTASPVQTVTVQNCGNGSLHISSRGASPEFFLGSGSFAAPLDLVAGGSTTFQIGFSPLGSGSRTGSVKIFSNAAGSPALLPVGGNATPAPVTTGTVIIQGTINGQDYEGDIGQYLLTWPSGGSIYFGTVPQTLTAQATGSYTLAFTGAPHGGTTVSGITPSTTQTLAAGDAITFTINLTGTDDFGFTNYEPPLVIPVGGSGSLSLTAMYAKGGAETLTLTASGLPPNTTASFNPQPILLSSSASSTVTVVTSTSTPPGIFTLTFSATNQDGVTRSISKPLAVVTPGATQLLSVAGAPGPPNGGGDMPSISSDGRYVAYWTGGVPPYAANVFVRDRLSGTTVQANLAYDGTQPNGSGSYLPSISASGRFVAFHSDASNLVSGVPGGINRMYVRDLQAAVTVSVGVATDGSLANGPSFDGTLSGDGRFVVFMSQATNLVSNPVNGVNQIYVRDLNLGTTSIVSVGNDGAAGDAASEYPVISGDGRYVAFFSGASNLVPGVTGTQVYLRDLAKGTTEVVSLAQDGTPANGFIYDIYEGRLAVTPDGRFIGFISSAPNFGSSSGNMNAIVRDRKMGMTTLASISNDGTPAGADFVTLSADGRFVAFSTPFFGMGSSVQVAIRDLVLAQTRIVSLSPGTKLGSAWSGAPVLSGDGRTLAFASDATNLVSGDTNGQRDIFAVSLSALQGVALQSLVVNPTSVVGGSIAQGTLTLSGPAPAVGAVIQISSSAVEALPPSIVTIPAGNAAATFSIPTLSVSSDRSATIIASYGGGSPWAVLALQRPAAARIDVVQGDGQTAGVGSPLPVGLAARVLDATNNPVPGVTVQFSSPATGPSGSFPGGTISVLASTDWQGVATAPTFTANHTKGPYAVTAAAEGVPSPAVFSIANGGNSFYTMTPCRILDTRNANGALGGPALQPGAARVFDVVVASCGIPAGAKAISVNLTVTQAAAAGNLSIYPGDGSPTTNAISISAGHTRTNNAVLGLAGDGSGTIGVFSNSAGSVHVILDVNGYFE